MKRSTSINLTAMQKQTARPLSVAVAASLSLTGCSDSQEAVIYKSIEECATKNPGQEETCKMAYENSEKEAERTAPKYRSQRDCEYDFGYDQCHKPASSSVFMPLMGGFMLGQMMNNSPARCGMTTPFSYQYNYCRSSPVFTSYSRRSRYYGDWIGADGRDYGSRYNSKVRANSKSFEKKPTIRRTMSRGGFGSRAAAKSSWSGGRSSGWGG